MNKESFQAAISRDAVVMEVGGFRPPNDQHPSSWFGKVTHCAEGEKWPSWNGAPLMPLAQVRIDELPFIPEQLKSYCLVTVFISRDYLPTDTENGDGWLVRTYEDLEKLVPMEAPREEGWIKSIAMRPGKIVQDFPCWEDLEEPLDEIRDDFGEDYEDLFKNLDGFKFGGWPTLIQSEIYWYSLNNSPSEPQYLFQIDSEPKANWSWDHYGVGYFGLGKDKKWFLAWQCN